MTRPLRSVLYVPASNARAVEKAAGLACDAVILDLEDAVSPERKPEARVAACAALGRFGDRPVVVRINAADSGEGRADLAALAAARAPVVLVPKVRGPEDLVGCRAALGPATELWAMVETCAAVLSLSELSRRAGETGLGALVVGTNDLAKEMGARPDPERTPLQAALSLTVCAARAAGIAALDGVFNRIDDLDGLERECAQGRAFGFDGKTLVHPSQIEVARAAFSPDEAEIAWARAVVEAFARPGAESAGAIRMGDEMVERLHLSQARRVLAAADRV